MPRRKKKFGASKKVASATKETKETKEESLFAKVYADETNTSDLVVVFEKVLCVRVLVFERISLCQCRSTYCVAEQESVDHRSSVLCLRIPFQLYFQREYLLSTLFPDRISPLTHSLSPRENIKTLSLSNSRSERVSYLESVYG